MIKYPEVSQPKAFRTRRNFLENQIPLRANGQLNDFANSRGWIPWGLPEDLRDNGEPAFTTVLDNVNAYNIDRIYRGFDRAVTTVPDLRQRMLDQNANLQAAQVIPLFTSYGW